MQAMGLPEQSGFHLEPKALPSGWGGLEVWCSFDQQGLFRLPQQERVVMPAGTALGSAVLPANQTNGSLTAANNQPMQKWLTEVPDDLRHHWHNLEQFRLYLDKIEEELKARDDRREQMPAPKISSLPGWWPRLMGGRG
jgi:hypothetical protein